MDLFEAIREVVGEAGLIVGDDVRARPADWQGRAQCGAMAVVRPRTTSELSAIMKLCHQARQPVVPAGGLTGLVHGVDAQENEVQISFERMRAIESIDVIGMTMVVEAGVPLQSVHEAAAKHGLAFGVDLGARGSCSIGGNISTNAGGNTVIRYGMMRENVLGLEVVLADGTIISSMNALLKNNAGYDLKHLFIGSEGTLGIVTRAVLRLRPIPASETTAILAINGFDNLADVFGLASRRLGGLLSSFEVMWREGYELVAIESGRHQAPLAGGYDFYVLLEATGTDPDHDAALVEAVLGECLEQGLAEDAVIASSKTQRNAMWEIREDSQTVRQILFPASVFDVSLPLATMNDFIEALRASLHAEWGDQVRFIVYGHIGDGNLHIIVSPRPWSPEARRRVEEIVYKPLAAINGSVSAEHGIGLEKREWLSISRTAQEIALMKQLKAALDPFGLLNPGKVLGEEAG
ncbi:FAD-binding oxidoreductase [Sphingomonas oligophenolica]|uniref:FAD-binding oxidoreductase n=1 Tax=Sphingomonas oligophenolica TaxID=301154 RepID=A0ABU9Y677_9SPHN